MPIKYVACYCRVSTEEQAKFGFSIQAQKDALERYCKENGYKYEFYVDEGISASSMKKRKALNEMLDKSNAFDMILFTKLDRLSRNVLDANNINEILKRNNCTMKAIDEDDIDTSTADGTFMFNLKVSLAQREIGKTSERIRFVFQNKREKGEVTSGTRKYGYDIVDKKFQINESEAENIRNLYKEFINNNGNLKLTYSYFIQHFPNKGYDAMDNYLKETAYIGKYKMYRKNIFLDNYIPPILDIDTWNQAQLLRKKKTVTRKAYDDKFSGLIYCAECGTRLCKKIDYRVKNIVVRYSCDNSYRFKVGTEEKRCYSNKLIREDYIEQYLLEHLNEEASKYIAKVSIVKSKVKQVDNTSKIKSIEKKLNKLKDLYIDDLIDKETYKKDYEKYQAKLNSLQISSQESIPEKDFSKLEQILNSNWKKIYNNLTEKNKKKFWLSVVDRICVRNGKIIEVTFL